MGQQLSLFSIILSQCYFIPTPALTEKNLSSQTEKVNIVTGGYTGVGYELVKILYQKGATVYILGRDERKGRAAIENARKEFPDVEGKLEFIRIDLADLRTVKPAAQAFLQKETRLDVLACNAGVLWPPPGSLGAQGHELQMTVNCLAHFTLFKALLPLLQKTAKMSPPGSVRVTWAASISVDLDTPKDGLDWDEETKAPRVGWKNYGYSQAKVGNVFLAKEIAKRFGREGIYSASFNPGNLRSELQRNMTWMEYFIVNNLMLYPVKFGAYTELYAGWGDLGESENGAWIVPWRWKGLLQGSIVVNLPSKDEGRTGGAERYWEWCEEQTREFQ